MSPNLDNSPNPSAVEEVKRLLCSSLVEQRELGLMRFADLRNFNRSSDATFLSALAYAVCSRAGGDPGSDQTQEQELAHAGVQGFLFLIRSGEAGTCAMIQMLESADQKAALSAAHHLNIPPMIHQAWEFAPEHGPRILNALMNLEHSEHLNPQYRFCIRKLKERFES